MPKAAILGSTGMLGSTLSRVLENQIDKVYEFNRSGISVTGNNEARYIDITKEKDIDLSDSFKSLEFDYIINCVGMIKQIIDERDQNSVNLTQEVNSRFPAKLNSYAKRFGIPLIQIGTDCVYSGKSGFYSETDPHDPEDLYGLSKSIGELSATNSMIIRCSIIGKELSTSTSLLEWVISQPKGAVINGYLNHLWNGVTTLHFSQIVSGVIRSGAYKPGIVHFVPKDIVSKYDLIKLISLHFGRSDLQINEFSTELSINRSLATVNPQQNTKLWHDGGYNEIPTIAQMVTSYAKWVKEDALVRKMETL